MEIVEQNKDIDTIVVPIGDGGLITGIAIAAKAINPPYFWSTIRGLSCNVEILRR